MVIEVIERQLLSPRAQVALNSISRHSDELEREKMSPQEAPDGSGKGKFHELLSFHLRRWAYETENHTFFYQSGWSADEKRIFQMLEGKRLEGVRQNILKYQGIDILSSEGR